MSTPLISVIVATYYPEKGKLLATLRSILLQKDCDFEIIVTDDGSADFPEADVRAFLENAGCPFEILVHPENQGTVRNLLDAAKLAKGTYVKTISPGDLLYHDRTLQQACEFMQQHNARVAFGDMAVYNCENGMQPIKRFHPADYRIYDADRKHYNFRKVLKHQLIYSDLICGAADLYERTTFCQGMEAIKEAVTYAEDSAYQLFTAQKVRIYRFPQKLVWYEHGTGISTNTDSPRFSRIDTDFYRFYNFLAQGYPDLPFIRRTLRFWNRRRQGSALKKKICRLLAVDKILFSLRRRLLTRLRPLEQDPSFFYACNRQD